MPREHAGIEPFGGAQSAPAQTEEVREIRRSYVEACIRRAEKEPQLVGAQRRMREGGGESVELLPVCFVDTGTELLPHRRARVWRQQLELRGGRSEADRVVDGRGDRRPVVLKESEHVERGGDDAEPAALDHDSPLVRGRNR